MRDGVKKAPVKPARRSRHSKAAARQSPTGMTEKDALRVVQELQIHQTELDAVAADRNLSELNRILQLRVEQQTAHLASILNAVAEAILTYDQRGVIVSANPATRRIFGYKQDELVGLNIASLMPQSGQRDVVFTPGSHIETIAVRKDGSAIDVDLSVNHLGRNGLLIGVARDISERKEAERQLYQHRRDLRTMSLELMLAEERERQKLAQDLHDGLGQALFRARLKLAEGKIDGPIARSLGAILEEIAKTVNALTFELSPPILRQLGFFPAVQWLADDMKRRYDLAVKVEGTRSSRRLDESIALVAFRSLRELLINVAKHAGTKQATVSIRENDQLAVTVQDSGAGFNIGKRAHSVAGGHFGLFSIRERVQYYGGSFAIESRPGKGTRASFTLPLQGRPSEA